MQETRMKHRYNPNSIVRCIAVYGLTLLFGGLAFYAAIVGADVEVVGTFDTVLIILATHLYLGNKKF